MVRLKCLISNTILKLMFMLMCLTLVSDTKFEEVDNGLQAVTEKAVTENVSGDIKVEDKVKKEIPPSSNQEQVKKNYTYIKNVKTFDLRTTSNLDETEVYNHLKRFKGLSSKSLANSIISAEVEYNVNAVFLMAIIRLESGNGTSKLAHSNNNLGGISDGHSYRKFKTKEQCVLYMAQLLSEEYLDKNGLWHGGGFTTKNINQYYCELPDWHKKINSLMLEIQNDIKMERSDDG